MDTGGAEHWLVAPDWAALRGAPAGAGGRLLRAGADDVDHGAIVDLEHDILARAEPFAGLLAYCNVRFASGQWGNLVLFADAAGPGHVWGDAVHADAIARTPRHYHSLRLHRGSWPAGCSATTGCGWSGRPTTTSPAIPSGGRCGWRREHQRRDAAGGAAARRSRT